MDPNQEAEKILLEKVIERTFQELPHRLDELKEYFEKHKDVFRKCLLENADIFAHAIAISLPAEVSIVFQNELRTCIEAAVLATMKWKDEQDENEE